MRLTHRQLEIFQSLMQTQSVTVTAHALFTSQPTISRELKDIEDILGFPLFYRENRRLEPSEEAMALYVVVQRSFIGIEEITRTAQAFRENRTQQLSIACLPAFAHALVPQVLRRFLAEHPKTSIKIHSLEEAALTRDLVSKFFDIGLVEGHFGKKTSLTLELNAGSLVCIMPASHPLVARRVLEPKDFSNQDVIYYYDDDSYRRKVDDFLGKEKNSRRLLVETTTAPSIGSLVQSGIGIAIVNPLTAGVFQSDDVVVRPLVSEIPYLIRVWLPEAKRQSPLLPRLLEILGEHVEERRHSLEASFQI